jgi:hypothetical protein
VALVGQMERELVAERGWLTKKQMREAIAICQSLPGPLAIQVGIFVSYLRSGFWGAWVGGWAFILPNFVIVAALGALYVYLGDLGCSRRRRRRRKRSPNSLAGSRLQCRHPRSRQGSRSRGSCQPLCAARISLLFFANNMATMAVSSARPTSRLNETNRNRALR